jgi:TetR/AcrR family transcriptional regulator
LTLVNTSSYLSYMNIDPATPLVAAAVAPAPRPGIAERLWEAAKIEFSQRGYHGARVQGIARRAGCNVALLYRHWASKKALYVEILRTTWQSQAHDVTTLLEHGSGASAVVTAYLDALLKDPAGSQILVRELLDGSPFLTQLVEAEPQLTETVRQAASKLAAGSGSGDTAAIRPGLDPTLAVLTVAGIASLVASAHQVARLWMQRDVTTDQWRAHLRDLLVNGLVECPPPR